MYTNMDLYAPLGTITAPTFGGRGSRMQQAVTSMVSKAASPSSSKPAYFKR